jgi:hypothetical protein
VYSLQKSTRLLSDLLIQQKFTEIQNGILLKTNNYWKKNSLNHLKERSDLQWVLKKTYSRVAIHDCEKHGSNDSRMRLEFKFTTSLNLSYVRSHSLCPEHINSFLPTQHYCLALHMTS